MKIKSLLIHLVQINDLNADVEIVLDTEDGNSYSSQLGIDTIDYSTISKENKVVIRACRAKRIET